MKKFIGEFKAFISRGNVMDMAVGVVIGSAFGKIVTSLVDDIIMPLIGVLIGGLNFSELSFTVKDATVKYGSFIQNIVNFLIIAFCIFLVVRAFNKVKENMEKIEKKLTKQKEEEKAKEEPVVADDVKLLTEIRDLLKKQK